MYEYREVEILGRFSLSKNQARMFHEEFIKITESGQELTAENIVKVASDPNSPMHGLFDWEDASAGHKFRLMQARKYVKEVQVKVEFSSTMDHKVNNTTTTLKSDPKPIEEKRPEPQIVTIPAWNHPKDTSKDYKVSERKLGAYNHYSKALHSRDEAETVVSTAWKELKRWYDRYKEKSIAYGQKMEHFSPVMREIEELERKMEERAVTEIAAAGQR